MKDFSKLLDEELGLEEKRKRERVAYLKLKEEQIKLREGLPFLHGWKWYTWAREFFESTNKMNFLCAANQISKSSTQIRKAIHWATAEDLWPSLWNNKPSQFWYLYPSMPQATIEFEKKWSQFLPKNEYKDHPVYGWRAVYKGREISAIHFNSGVSIYFKSYTQDPQVLQTGTCDAIFCDEELPVEIYEELVFRLSASDGYFHMVFTATLGQDFWRLVMEPGDKETEKLPTAFKKCVSIYDCKYYEDGTPSHWTDDKIQMVVDRCRNQNEILKRVFGRFVVAGGRKYGAFDMKRHLKPGHPLPKDWHVYGAADVGSGGKEGHPAAICFVAVAPDYRSGRVFLGWRGDGIPTTAGDVVEKFIAMKKEYRLKTSGQYYDWASKDFFNIAVRMGEPFAPADKSHERGEQVLNTLFKNDMLLIYDNDELQKLVGELSTLMIETPKNKAKDDFCDALRYAVTQIPWDWSAIASSDEPPTPGKELTPAEKALKERVDYFNAAEEAVEQERIDEEIAEWNQAYGLEE